MAMDQTTPPQVEQTERELFEAWALRNGYSTFTTPGAVGPDGLMVYHDARTHAAWWAWQARASMQAQAPEVAALQREVEELRAANERMAEWINGDCFCPCCGNTIACTDGCDFATDCPDAAQRMAEARAVLSYRAIRSEGNQ